MTAKRTQVGVLAVGLLAILVAIGCSSDSDVISSGNVVVAFPADIVDPSAVDYQCIRLDYNFFRVKPADGACSADAGMEFEGLPCGTDTDCSDVAASCDNLFPNGCEGGANQNQDCDGPEDCPDGECVPRRECALPGGSFTGQGCISDLDCTPGSAEKCSGRCSAGSSNPGGACLDAGDCTAGECLGAQAADTLGGRDVSLINTGSGSSGVAVYFTDNCPACDLENPANPVLCDPTDPLFRCAGSAYDGQTPVECTTDADCPLGDNGTCEPRCTNRCRDAEDLDLENIPCSFARCCEKFDLVAPECETTADCQVNQCVESSLPLASAVLPEGKYLITELQVGNLAMFANGAPTELVSCGTSGTLSGQFDPPLVIAVGPGLSNQVRSVMNVTELERLLGYPLLPGTPPDCDAAFSDLPAWFNVVSE